MLLGSRGFVTIPFSRKREKVRKALCDKLACRWDEGR
jgi:hypothetical protein